MNMVARKTVLGVSDEVRHIYDCTVTEPSLTIEISDLETRVIILSIIIL